MATLPWVERVICSLAADMVDAQMYYFEENSQGKKSIGDGK